MVADYVPTLFIIGSVVLGVLFAVINAVIVSKTNISIDIAMAETSALVVNEGGSVPVTHEIIEKMKRIGAAISQGAQSFLFAEYRFMVLFIVVFSIVILCLLGSSGSWKHAAFSMMSFQLGAVTSIISGYIGMKIAVYSNTRTAINATKGVTHAFNTAFRAGTVMGFALQSLGLINLFIGIVLFKLYFTENKDVPDLYEAISAYGLGGSSIAMFGRVGGGIYTKAADVGADLVGKVEQGIPEDDPRNPAVIADNVGDNVGDVAGMGADLFGSFAEASSAALAIASESLDHDLIYSWPAMMYPLTITASGILVSMITTFFATNIGKVKNIKGIEPVLKRQLLISTILMTPTLYGISMWFLPHSFTLKIGDNIKHTKNWKVYFCVISGLWSGLIIGYVTEFFTSHAYKPVRDVAHSCKTGAATNVIYGLALGYKSVIIPIFCLATTIYVSYKMASMYGIAVAALGILSTMAVGLTIDAYGPISDNAGGVAEMCGMGPEIRSRTDALDAAGNTTAAIGKGFAIGSAALVSIALWGAFITKSNISRVDLMKPYEYAGLVVGAMLPYWFSAMTMKSVGKAALAMVEEVRDQFKNIEGIMEGTGTPDYKRCVKISTDASLREMIPPGALVILSPILVGYIFGKDALSGLLAGALVSGVQLAISMSNTGGAWDNAKKYIESGEGGLGGKGSDAHHAAVVGDTIGDPLKDTSGPSLNILVKLMAIISLVFAPSIKKHGGQINNL
eukprot:TRINITY_DN1467_c0_g1_i1.p1 TRINITY_DN1467_c0_g1~~TRINITY_DN1467_c0_g1_i1.p1  ORF type:complete len:736 (-),score=170.10 TRINITY_DN1467_c0_g1_i1:139-2346(-)